MEVAPAPSPPTSLDIPPELLEFLKNDPSYVICPKCNNVWEHAGAGNEDDCRHVKTSNGKLLTAEGRAHYSQHRFRCHRCESIFCSQCKRIPYHVGYTCDQFDSVLTTFKCRWCNEGIPEDVIAINGPPREPKYLSCADCKEKDNTAMKKLHPMCNHAVLWHHSMPTRKLANCIDPECVEKRGDGSVTKEDYCNICWVEELGAHPCIRLNCGHMFHAHCVRKQLSHRWDAGGPVMLSFSDCPLCKVAIKWPAICQPYVDELRKLQEMRSDLKSRSLQQLETMELPEDIAEGGEDVKFAYARSKLNFYECFSCKSFYFGGKKECDAQINAEDDAEEIKPDPVELICGGCRGSCEEHGTENMVFKCRFCCSVASYFCFGHTHFCQDCHSKPWTIVSQNNYQFVVGKLNTCKGPEECPLGIEHAPTGEEFVLGCAACGEFKHIQPDGLLSTEEPKREE